MRRTPSGSLTMSTLPRIVLEKYTRCSKASMGTISKALPFEARKVLKNDAAFGGGGASPASVFLTGLVNVVIATSILRAVHLDASVYRCNHMIVYMCKRLRSEL